MVVARVFEGPFTVDDYYRLAECGILHEDSRVELIDGQVVPMNPIGDRHGGRVNYLNNTLARLIGNAGVIAVQNPVRLGPRSEPQPDIVIARPRPDFYSDHHPTPADVLLLIEVADSSIDFDREVKIPLYARTGIPEVWICDLDGDGLEVYRVPSREGYGDIRVFRRGESVTSLHLPGVTLAVADVLGTQIHG